MISPHPSGIRLLPLGLLFPLFCCRRQHQGILRSRLLVPDSKFPVQSSRFKDPGPRGGGRPDGSLWILCFFAIPLAIKQTWDLKYEKSDIPGNSVFTPCSTVRLDRSRQSPLLLNGRSATRRRASARVRRTSFAAGPSRSGCSG